MGIDLVKIQLLLAQGHSLSCLPNLPEDPETPPPIRSLQLRVTAEDVSNDWSLTVGKINSFRFPTGNGIRVDTHLVPSQSAVIGADFDSLLAKIIITAPTWNDIVPKAKRALADTRIDGVKTSLDILRGIVESLDFANQACDTQWLETNLGRVLKSGIEISTKSSSGIDVLVTSGPSAVAAASNVLFRKGDAWYNPLHYSANSIFLTENYQVNISHSRIIQPFRSEKTSTESSPTNPRSPQRVPHFSHCVHNLHISYQPAGFISAHSGRHHCLFWVTVQCSHPPTRRSQK
jgi:acetyl/propionyl-CoA carboxylase alpha subunit